MTVKHIYVSGPYTAPDPVVNTREAIIVGTRIAEAGGVPFIPHLTHFWHLVDPHSYDFWLKQDLAWIARCDAFYRIPGTSNGADAEQEEAERLKLPVFTGINGLEFLLAELRQGVKLV